MLIILFPIKLYKTLTNHINLFLFLLFFFCMSHFSLVYGNKLDSTYHKAQVIIDGYTLFSVRGISSYPAEERARVIKERIEDIAKDYSLSVNSIRVVHSESSDDLYAQNKIIIKVYDFDSQLEGVRREVLAIGLKKRVMSAINSYRYERKSEILLKRTFYATGATLLTILLLLLIRWTMKKGNSILENKLKVKLENLETRSFQLIKSNQIWLTLYSLIKGLKFLIALIIIFIYAQYVLGLYPWTRSVSVSLIGYFLTPVSAFGMAMLNFIPDLAFLIVIFFITRYLLKLIKIFFEGIGKGLITISTFDPDWAIPTYKIVRVLLVAFAVIVAYPYIPGSDSAAFKGVSLFIGILFSLGSSSVIGNLIAGYTMTYRKTFKIGDVVQIEGHVGQIAETKLFVTRLHTPKNEEVIIPNSVILNNNVVNYSTLSNIKGLILHTTVGIGYETPWRQVEGMLMLAADRTTGVLKDPPPFVLQKLLGDFAVNYELNAYTNNPINRNKVYTELHQNILDVFNENNIQIMTPAYEGDPQVPKVVPKDQWFTPVVGKTSSGEGE